MNNLVLRSATQDDIWEVYRLANSPDIRSVSFHPRHISREEHEMWYQQKLTDKNCIFMIISNKAKDFIGSIRFDLTKPNTYLVSVYLAKIFRGYGIGTQAIFQASKMILTNNPAIKIKAQIKKSNIGSYKSFLNAGYREVKKSSIYKKAYIEMIFP